MAGDGAQWLAMGARLEENRWGKEEQRLGRLEFVSDKIQSGDSKRKVMHIRFGCPTKKNGFG
jgi:hypothetical protein